MLFTKTISWSISGAITSFKNGVNARIFNTSTAEANSSNLNLNTWVIAAAISVAFLAFSNSLMYFENSNVPSSAVSINANNAVTPTRSPNCISFSAISVSPSPRWLTNPPVCSYNVFRTGSTVSTIFPNSSTLRLVSQTTFSTSSYTGTRPPSLKRAMATWN